MTEQEYNRLKDNYMIIEAVVAAKDARLDLQSARIAELEAHNAALRAANQDAQLLARKFEDMYATAFVKFSAGDPRPFAITGTTQTVPECTNEPHQPRR